VRQTPRRQARVTQEKEGPRSCDARPSKANSNNLRAQYTESALGPQSQIDALAGAGQAKAKVAATALGREATARLPTFAHDLASLEGRNARSRHRGGAE